MDLDQFHTYPRGRFLPGTRIEIRGEAAALGKARSALFDFDGTISLIRSGWQDVMIPMMVETLQEASGAEPPDALERLTREFVDKLTGKQTIFQMMQLAEEVKKRGGQPLEPLEYKRRYNDLLMARIGKRREALKDGTARPEDLTMPRAAELLERLRERGLSLYLASGTDYEYVCEEAEMLGVADYFDGGIYAAQERVEDFSKAQVIRQMLREHELSGPELLSFGDGYVEILNAKEAGGIAVGVASDEVGKVNVNEWKRNRLIQAGADLIAPGYAEMERMLAYLLDGER
ncbi:MAG: haloacid dehalogenase-like hydrolase [Candidatus Poribacteria bacterium]|nr:haloacid dehalogenase-like hydrolase [Candidatus Poribacteria bacterium]